MIETITTVLASLLAVSSAPPREAVTWVHSLADAQARAAAEHKPILAYCWGDGSEFCGKLYEETLAVAATQQALDDFVCFSAKHGEDGVAEFFEHHRVSTLPTMLFLGHDGAPEDLIQGFIPADAFVDELRRIQRGEGTVSGLRARVAAAEAGSEDLMEARWLLAGKLFEFGDVDGQDQLTAQIRAEDPKGRTATGAIVLLNEIVAKAAEAGGDDIGAWDLEPIYAFARDTKVQTARFEAWNRLLNIETSKQDAQAALAAARQAFECVPDERAFSWCDSVARWVVENVEQLSSKERKFALEISTASVARLEAELRALKKRGADLDETEGKLARALNTQAWTFHVQGKTAQAVAAARRSVALRDREDYQNDLRTFRADG